MVEANRIILESYFLTKALRPRTLKSYSQVLYRFSKQIKHFGITGYDQLTRHHLELWRAHELQDNNLSAISWNSYCRTLHALFEHALEQKLVDLEKNHFKGLLVRPPRRRKKTLEATQLKAITRVFELLEEAELKNTYSGRIHPVWFWRTVFETLYYTGIRRRQLISLHLKDVCLSSGTLALSHEGAKTHSENKVPIPEALIPRLQTLTETARSLGFRPNDQLFNVTRFGTHRYKLKTMQDANVSNCFRELGALLGFPVSPHRLRHTLGTNLMRQPEKNLHLVKEILGHSDIRTTLEYIEPSIPDMRHLLNTMPNLVE